MGGALGQVSSDEVSYDFEGKVMAMVQLSAYEFKDSAIQPYISSVSSAKCTSDSDFRAGFW